MLKVNLITKLFLSFLILNILAVSCSSHLNQRQKPSKTHSTQGTFEGIEQGDYFYFRIRNSNNQINSFRINNDQGTIKKFIEQPEQYLGQNVTVEWTKDLEFVPEAGAEITVQNLIDVKIDKQNSKIKQTKFSASRAAETGCYWEKLDNTAASILAQNCNFDGRLVNFKFKDNSFIEVITDAPDDILESTVITIFDKKNSESAEETLQRLFISKLSDYERIHCIAQEASPEMELESTFTDPNKKGWVISPDQEYSDKINRETPDGEMPSIRACGDYGNPLDYRAYFEFNENNKNKFAWVVIGQDTPLFDTQSLELK